MASVALPIAIGSLLELGIAGLGARFGGLVGLSLGWVVAVCIEAIFMFPAVYRAAFPVHESTWEQVKQIVPTRNNRAHVENERV
jgi:hypothetical protein